jgi:hypothetical protein
MNDIRRCGGCHFAKVVPAVLAQDLTRRVCYGAPPTPSHVATQGGAVTMRMARPIVSVSEEACALWRGKDAADLARDDDAFMLQSQLGEPKQ